MRKALMFLALTSCTSGTEPIVCDWDEAMEWMDNGGEAPETCNCGTFPLTYHGAGTVEARYCTEKGVDL